MGNRANFDKFFFGKILRPKNFNYRIILGILQQYLKEGFGVLDAGCGEGNISMFIADYGAHVVGIDTSRNLINICEKKSERLRLTNNTRFVCGDLERYKFKNRFDLIVCIEVIEHLENGHLVLDKLNRLLNSSGVLILSTPSQNAPLFHLGLTKREDKRSGHLRRYTLEELVSLLKKGNLNILEARKTEGILRNFLFYNRLGILPLKLANRFTFISDLLTVLDNITLKSFGESQIIVVAQKPGRKRE